MQIIPIQAIPSQIVTVVLGGQNCQIQIDQKNPCIFVSINADGNDISLGVRARNVIALNANVYEPFDGNLIFWDNQGKDDPVYTGLGSRFLLVYLTEAEYAQL